MSVVVNPKSIVPANDEIFHRESGRKARATVARSESHLEEEFRFARINRVLKNKFGECYRVERFYGEDLATLSEDVWKQIAHCYKTIFNESWGESWTDESAMTEVRKMLDWTGSRIPLAVLLYHESKVIGFSMGQVMEKKDLTLEEDMSPTLPLSKKKEGMAVMKYWLGSVVNKEKFLFFRELGVLREYQLEVSPFLGLPLIEKARKLSCDVVFCRVNTKCKAFKWHLGVGFSPIHFFRKNNLLLMLGSAKYAAGVLENMIRQSLDKDSHRVLMGNINRYLCR